MRVVKAEAIVRHVVSVREDALPLETAICAQRIRDGLDRWRRAAEGVNRLDLEAWQALVHHFVQQALVGAACQDLPRCAPQGAGNEEELSLASGAVARHKVHELGPVAQRSVLPEHAHVWSVDCEAADGPDNRWPGEVQPPTDIASRLEGLVLRRLYVVARERKRATALTILIHRGGEVGVCVVALQFPAVKFRRPSPEVASGVCQRPIHLASAGGDVCRRQVFRLALLR
mmetsp:Transcript_98381/g.228144  ORF Transcript_98381/g.228144 Transcript_98381/m.228144 type:complete len:230 (+) Transcript_98381:439-1128(+)